MRLRIQNLSAESYRDIFRELYRDKVKNALNDRRHHKVKNDYNVIGATIGCYEGWHKRAEMAAERFTKFTGIPCKIIDESYLDRVNLREVFEEDPNARAALLKLYLFDIIEKYENIIYFDSDIAYLKKWDPLPYLNKKEFICVKDRWWMQELIEICDKAKLDRFKYFNTGFFIANRRYHLSIFEYARKLYNVVDIALYEQTAFNSAAQQLDFPLRFISQSYNCIGLALRQNHVPARCVSYMDSIFCESEIVAMHWWKPSLWPAAFSGYNSDMWDEIFDRIARPPKKFFYDEPEMSAIAKKYTLINRAGDELMNIELYPDGTTDDEYGWMLSRNSDKIVLFYAKDGKIFNHFYKVNGNTLKIA